MTAFLRPETLCFSAGRLPWIIRCATRPLNRVWTGGLEVKPIHHVGLRATGNYDRTTGVGQIGTRTAGIWTTDLAQ